MPIYEYRCEQGHNFEVLQRMSDDPVEVCETCSAPATRVFRPVAVHFKGSGFYNTDYGTRKRSRELKEAANGNGKAGKDDGGSKSSTDSKPSSDSKSSSGSEGKSSDTKSSTPAKTASSSKD